MNRTETIKRFAGMDEDGQLAELYTLRDRPDVLRTLRDLLGLKECPADCQPERLPCPKHQTWYRQHKDGMPPRAIAADWHAAHGERVKTRTVRRFLRRGRPEICSCAVGYRACNHL